ncbi:MAG: multiheme c-type cytochrome [Pirellulales bacterium]
MQTNAAQRYLWVGVLLLPTFAASVVGFVSAQTSGETPQGGNSPAPISGPALELNATSCPSDATDNEHAYSGWQNCDFCHGRSDDRPLEEDLRQDILVASLNESTIWRHKDKHELAARVLLPDEEQQNLAYHMQQALGVDRYNELVANDCQACHVAGEPDIENVAAKSGDGPNLKHQFGVTCEACHGPAKDWVHDHWEQRKTWRYKTPAEKADAGFVNLRDPVTKARKCLSCHLGSVREEKIVTHEMYAAGHPPLAGFDAATYSLAMPRHWTPLSERSDEKFDEYKQIHGASQVHAANTREVLLGGLAALASNLTLLADYAAQPSEHSAWPEFALYDCFACHHDLQAQSLRLRSRGGRQAGRPPLRMWPNVVADLALRQTEGPTELTTVLADVSAALAEQPFAERDQLRTAAGAAGRLVCQEIDRLADQLDRSKLPEGDDAKNRERELVVRVLERIGDVGSNQLHDYDSARQLVWAFERVFDDYKKLSSASTNYAAVDQALRELKAPSLKFELISGKQSVGEPGTLAAFLQARRAYDPQKFADGFGRLRDAMRESVGRKADL